MARDMDQPEVGLLFDQTNRYGTTYWEAHPVKMTDPMLSSLGLRNFNGSHWNNEVALSGLVASTFEFESADEGFSTVAYSLRYRDITVEATDLEPMVLLMRKVNRELAKAEERDGAPANFGQYVARVARAIGATKIVFSADPPEHRGRFFDSNRYLPMLLGPGADHIAAVIRDWCEQKNREKAAAA